MPSITFDGKQHFIPGVYDKTIVRSSLPGPLPLFHIPILQARGWEGHPYDADSKKLASENDFTPFRAFGTAGSFAEYFGANSDMHRATVWGKRHGLPLAWGVNLAPLTRASLVVQSTGPISQFTVYPKSFGAPPHWMKIGWVTATGIWTIVPLKNYAMVAQDVGPTDTRIFVTGENTWLVEGLTVTLGDNVSSAITRDIVDVGQDIGADGRIDYWIELDSALGSSIAVATHAIVLTYDETGKVENSTPLTTGQQILDYFSQDPTAKELIVAEKDVAFTDALPIDVATPIAFKDITAWGAVVVGTSPAPTSTDVQNFVDLMNGGEFDAFAVREQALPNTYLLAVGDSASHVVMRDYATAERTRGFPINLTTGVRWGDTDLAAGDDTNPTVRSAALDSQDTMLIAGGLDREAAYISHASAVWARRIEGGPGHNLTNDELIFSEREVAWNEVDDGELTELLKKGVDTYKLSVGQGIRYKVAQGISTLQNNQGAIWNETDATSWSVMQRDLADFVNAVIKRDFEELQVGADQVDANSIAAVLTRRAEKSLENQGFILEFTITSIELNDAGNGFDVKWSVRLPITNDFMTIVTTILIGE
jgi:hypothetical protein